MGLARQEARPTLHTADIGQCLIFLFALIPLLASLLSASAATVTNAPNSKAPEYPLYVGWAAVDITPPKPVALIGQLHKRISRGVLDPLTATALALETRGPAGEKEQAILVSCDLLFMQKAVQDRLREKLRSRLPDFEVRKLFLNATHTHTGPGFIDSTFRGLYDVSNDPGVMKASEYADFFLEKVASAVEQAWRSRQPGSLSWALSHAVISMNRRAQSFDGRSLLYGNTDDPQFSNLEGGENHSVGLLFFGSAEKALTGVIINLPCPAQETEHLEETSADFWHDTRREIRRRLQSDLYVLPQCAPAGDLSPHLLFRKEAERRMLERRGLSRRQEIARRIASAVEDGLATARKETRETLAFRHEVVLVDIPEHQPPADPFYETDPVKALEIHVLRLGDVAIATSPFELFLDYAVRIEARSRAPLTLLIQLCGQSSGYLPTEKAVRGGGYSADKFIVGPVGGQVLVEETVKHINQLWP